jgi:hypothetical protein
LQASTPPVHVLIAGLLPFFFFLCCHSAGGAPQTTVNVASTHATVKDEVMRDRAASTMNRSDLDNLSATSPAASVSRNFCPSDLRQTNRSQAFEPA